MKGNCDFLFELPCIRRKLPAAGSVGKRAQQDRGRKDPVFCRVLFTLKNGQEISDKNEKQEIETGAPMRRTNNGVRKKAGETDMEQKVVLTMRDISKTFPGVKALQHVDFTLREGEIHALMGENGAGKSTLIKVLTGVHDFEAGEIKMAGKDAPIINKSPQDAQNNGISTVYQEVNLCPNLTVAENLFIGREPRKAGFIDWKTMNKKSSELLKSLDIDANATDKLEECSLAKQQMIAIARAVDMKCRVLILDEPTSSLDDDEVEKLFVLMRRLRGEGVGIIFVTHFL